MLGRILLVIDFNPLDSPIFDLVSFFVNLFLGIYCTHSFPRRDFEQHAIGVLQECYEENETLSQTLLVKELDNFGHLTALDLAVMAEDQDFISHTSCQVLLTRLWMGTMAMNTQWWKVRKTTFILAGVG